MRTATLLPSTLASCLVGSALLHGSGTLWLATRSRTEAPVVALERGTATSRARLVLRDVPHDAEPAPAGVMALDSPRADVLVARSARRGLEPPPGRVALTHRTAASSSDVEGQHTPSLLPPLARSQAPAPPSATTAAHPRIPLDLERSLAGQERTLTLASGTPASDTPAAAADLGAVLTEQPRALRNPRPEYPSAARASGVEGTVMLLVTVSRTGGALRVTVERSSGSELLDRAAVRAVERWRFTPARRAGAAVEADVRVPVTFRLTGERR